MEYFLIILSTVLFGGQFIALNFYQDKNGKIIRSILLFCSVFSFIGAFVFLCLSGFCIGFSWYTLLFASIAACIQITLQLVGLKALSLGRVEIYTLFNVAGGMSVAYIFGITYFHEAIKVTHIIGLFVILSALIVPIVFDRQNKTKSPLIFWILCLLVFLSNGFFGTVNKIHIVSGNGLNIRQYLFYVYLVIFVLSTIPLLFSFFKKDKVTKTLFNPKAVIAASIYGLVNSFGMFLQYCFADRIPASILFPLTNAGCIVFALIFTCLFYRKKPKLPDIIQFVIALGGMLLFII